LTEKYFQFGVPHVYFLDCCREITRKALSRELSAQIFKYYSKSRARMRDNAAAFLSRLKIGYAEKRKPFSPKQRL
jgi:hypothetical protein